MNHRCPDCSVSLQEVGFKMQGAYEATVHTGEKKEGILGTLGMDESATVDAGMCPECGLVRLYANVED